MSNLVSHVGEKIVRRAKRELTILQTKSKIIDYQSIEGFLSVYEAAMLYNLAATLPLNSRIVEIGTWKGKSTYCLARGLKLGKVITIDPFDASGEEESQRIYESSKGNEPLFHQFESQMQRLGVMDKIEALQGYSQEFVGQVEKIDLLFIDGDHSKEGCDFDFMQYSPAISVGGYLLLHDFDRSRKDLGPTWVVENRVLPSPDYAFVGLFDSLWVGKRIQCKLCALH